MGLFGGSKTYVSSVLYNMAGDVLNRPNFLKTAVMSNIILNPRAGMGETLRKSYLTGPGLRMRSFFNWANTHYDKIGVPVGSLGGAMNLDLSVISGEIPPDAGKTVQVQLAETGTADYSYWAEQWMFANYPAQIDTEWTSDISETTGDITVTLVDLSTHVFTPVNFTKDSPYLYVVYSQASAAYNDAPIVGATETLPPGQSFTDTTGWTVVSDATVAEGANHRTTTVLWKTFYMGQDPDPMIDRLYSIKKTITKTVLADPADVVLERTEQLTTQKLVLAEVGQAQMFIYKIGSGNNTLDGLIYSTLDDGEYIPFIPIRVDNKFLSETYCPEEYHLAKKAYKKATGSTKFDKLIEDLKDNPSLPDIDYAYVMYGVALNMIDKAGREYIYRFFDKLRLSATSSNIEYLLYQTEHASYSTATADYAAWRDAQSTPGDPLYGTPAPTLPGLGTKPGNEIHVKSNGTGALNTNLDMSITWQTITRSTGTGLKKVGAKRGDYWLTQGVEAAPTIDTLQTGVGGTSVSVVRPGDNTIQVHHQITLTTWETLTIVGAVHKNLIYNNKSVDITAFQALDDAEESGFLIPLHYATMHSMGLKNYTQLSTACGYVVFNSYKVVKQKWYQTGIFKIFVFIAIIALTVVTAGASTPLIGILGSAASVGAAVGLTGTLALIAGAAINAIVAMILMKIIAVGSTAIFGAKFGAIIAAVASLVVMQIGTSISSGQSLSAAWGNLMNAQNIINLTMAAGNGVSGYITAGAMETYAKVDKMNADYQKRSKELQSQYADEFGYDKAALDPLGLTDVFGRFSIESNDGFLDRTLMCGSDIAGMSLDMLTNFADLTLTLKTSVD